MDKYAAYIKERSGGLLYEDKFGFFTYRIEDENFIVDEIFVVPRFRNNGQGKTYSNKIEEFAKDAGCKHVVCTVCIRSKNYMDSFKFIEKMGYRVLKNEYTLIYLVKEL